jgi:hypothetical protein
VRLLREAASKHTDAISQVQYIRWGTDARNFSPHYYGVE